MLPVVLVCGVDGFDLSAHYSQDLPEGEYAIKQPTVGVRIAAAYHPCLIPARTGSLPMTMVLEVSVLLAYRLERPG